MFVVNSKWTTSEHDVVDLIVHSEITTFRRLKGDGDNWERQLSTGKWEEEDYLGEIVTECFDSVPDGYRWSDNYEPEPQREIAPPAPEKPTGFLARIAALWK